MFLLSQMKTKKVNIVVFGGTKGSGKSFLANYFVNNIQTLSDGFKLSHMQGSTTSGIFIWSKPIALSETTDALVLDCSPINNGNYSVLVTKKLLQISLILSS